MLLFRQFAKRFTGMGIGYSDSSKSSKRFSTAAVLCVHNMIRGSRCSSSLPSVSASTLLLPLREISEFHVVFSKRNHSRNQTLFMPLLLLLFAFDTAVRLYIYIYIYKRVFFSLKRVPDSLL